MPYRPNQADREHHMGEVRYVTRQGRRIQVETDDFGVAPRQRVSEPFVKVPLRWIAEAAKATRSPSSVVLAEILYTAWKTRRSTFPLSNSRLARLGASREIKRRVLRDLEQARLIMVARKPGRAPLVTLIAL
jgi:hypothetical protein